MLKQWICVAVMALSCVVMTGCSSSGGSASSSQADVLAVTPVTILSRAAGNDAAFKDTGVYLVNSAAELEKLGAASLTSLEVDFDSQSVIVLAQGECKSGGHWVHIDAIQKLGDTLYIQGTANIPTGVTTEQLTYPYEAVVVSKTSGLLVPEVTPVEGKEHPAD